MQADERRPVLVGWGQAIQRDEERLEEALEPVGLMERCARDAVENAGCAASALDGIDTVAVADVLGWRKASSAQPLAERLGLPDAHRVDTTIGGNSPQLLVTEFARRISRGDCRSVLLAGAEAIRSRRLAGRAGVELSWSRGSGPVPAGREMLGDPRPGANELEQQHGMWLPVHVFPIYENALRARLGRNIEEHQRWLGELCHRFTQIAAANPHAWFPVERSTEEIATVTATNRMIAFPYTKYMNAVMEVDLGAAVWMTSLAEARALGIADERLVYVWGGGDAHEDAWFVSERPALDRSPSQALAIHRALAEAGVTTDEIGAFDLYSCFPVAVELACEALGIGADDPRPLTVTGGLAYAGGPGNAYCLHGIACMMERLRERGGLGMVTGVGWHMSKHSAGVYGSEPPSRPSAPPPAHEAVAALEPVAEPAGKGTVEAYTVVHGRDGAPERGIVLGRDAESRRFVANTPEDRTLLEDLETRECVGLRGSLSIRAGVGRFAPE